MFGRDPQRTGRSPFTGPQVPEEKWSFATGDEIRSSPAISADGTIWRRIRMHRPLLTLPYELGFSLLLLVGVFSLIYLPGESDLTYPLIFNVLLLLGIIGLVFGGYYRSEESWINIALVFFGVAVFARYFEFSFNLFDRSLVFIGAGSILLAGGFFLERGHRKVMERIRTSGGVV